MRRALAGMAGLLIGAAAAGAPAAETAAAPLATGGPAIHGSYAAGCIGGAKALPPEGPGYQAIRLSRGRFYGHPELIDMLSDLGRRVEAAGLGLMVVGDLGHARGGPMPSGHASHQIGLDADVWLRLDMPPLPRDRREVLQELIMVDHAARRVIPGLWGRPQAELIRLAAEDPRVSRIFINPAIKQALCQAAPADDRDWLRKVRPWFGHAGHLHIRLHCPADSPGCKPQEPVPPGDGCGAELASWLQPPPPAPPGPPKPPEPRREPVLPAACAAVMAGP